MLKKQPKFQLRHYEEIARIFRDHNTVSRANTDKEKLEMDTLRQIAFELGAMLKADNRHFNYSRFMTRCGWNQ